MSEFLGVQMTIIMVVLLALFALSVGAVAYIRLRSPILFDIGLRNIPRRRAQSVLIVLGLMLSTVIISAAFATGDTVDHSITNDAYDKLGHVDLLAQARSNSATQSLTEEQIMPPGLVSGRVVATLLSEFASADEVDGVLPGLRFPAPVRNRSDEQYADPQVVIIGLDQNEIAGFENDIMLTDGTLFPISQLDPERAQALVNESAARSLNLKVGSAVDVYVDGGPRTLAVQGIVKDTFLTGWTRNVHEGILVPGQTIQFLFSRISPTTGAGFVAISNDGGVRDSVGASDRVQRQAQEAILTSQVEVLTIKQDRIDRAQELGSDMAAIFVVLGLFTIAAGMLLIFLILMMLAAERRTEMGMSRAVGMKRAQLVGAFMAEGLVYSMAASLIGVAIGVLVSLGMTEVMAYVFNRFEVDISFYITPRSLLVSYCLGVVLTFVTVSLSAWRVSRLHIVEAIREVSAPPPRATGLRSGLFGLALCAAGVVLVVLGVTGDVAWSFGSGVSLALVGAALIARAVGAPERWVFTATSAGVLVLWVLVAGGDLEPLAGRLDAGIETFFVGGVMMVASATFIIIYNAEFLLGSLRATGIVFARAVPAVRTATAYPLANKSRTGMTIAMLSLVVFALVMISTMNLNFRRLFLSDDARGGWDIEVEALPTNLFPTVTNNPRGPLGEALDRAFFDTRQIAAIGQAGITNDRNVEITQVVPDGAPKRPKPFRVLAADRTFLEENAITLQARAQGYNSDRAVWDAVRDNESLAVIDGSVVPGINYANVTESRFTLRDYESGTQLFEPIEMELSNSTNDTVKRVRVIGIMTRGASETYGGLWMNRAAVADIYPTLGVRYWLRLQPGADAESTAAGIETALVENGVSAHSIEKQVESDQELNTAFFYLIQGFLALGLGVGLAALAVIALRTVVERRQQIGLMRAIGFSRNNVALTFLLESAFIAFLGIINGIWPALLLASRLLSSEQFSTAGFTEFYVPWMQITVVAVLVFIAAVLTTIIPSRQASSIPIAEALRYE